MPPACKYHPELLLAFFQREKIALAGTHLLVAYSGGLDSSVLAASLAQLRSGQRLSITLAHVNHHLREDSGRDEAHCRRVAAQLDLPLHVVHLDPRERHQESVEAWARRERYAALELLAAETGARWILTGHHAGDQVETVLMRLRQRSGLLALAGIRPRRGLILRPLLDFSRDQLRRWAEAQALVWWEDPSNNDRRFLRNRLRQDLSEGFLAREPAAIAALLNLSRLARRYEAACAGLAHRVVSRATAGDLPGTCEVPWAVLRAVEKDSFTLAVSGLVERHLGITVRLSKPHWQTFRNFVQFSVVGKVFDLTPNVQVLRDRHSLIYYRTGAERGPEPCQLLVGTTIWGRHALEVTVGNGYQALPPGLQVRTWQVGDRVKFGHGAGHKLVSDIFVDARLSRLEKNHWPVVAGPGNRALWVPGLAVPRQRYFSAGWSITWHS
ncbi:MAG: tRNA lysidine(34) synthetase TilS [Candidatus Marinimicrobia bacterium]|nr:tRNA lysidine(34) synthetase TilS [Candidatus Neomarinimicrobiota bacterium]